jgi:hypothetical protein
MDYLRTKVREVLETKESGLDAVKDNFAFEIERYLTLTQVWCACDTCSWVQMWNIIS